MAPAANRRDFLRISLGAAAGLSFSGMASAERRQRPGGGASIAVTRLADRLLQLSGAGGHVVVFEGPDGLLLVNGGAAEHGADLLAALDEQFPRAPVRTLFNTDWHPDHTGANERLGKAGADIIAHEHTKQYLGADIFVDWQERTYKARPKALPTKTFYTAGELIVGGERVQYGHLGQAHTDSDIYVYFPGPNVLVAGDAVSVGRYPIADYTTGGWLGGLATASRTLVELCDDRTRVVPGVGPLQTRADVQAQQEMLTTLRDRIRTMMRQGMGTADMLAAGVTKEFDATWGDPALFLATAYRGMWLHVRELGGIV